MSRKIKYFFNWCPAPPPPPTSALRQYSKPIIVIAAATTILVAAILAPTFFAMTSTVAAPLADQLQDQLGNLISPESTPEPSPTAAATDRPSGRSSTSSSSSSSSTTQSQSTTEANYTVSGYILDANGAGIADAQIIFCVPDIIPAVFTNSSGYYQATAPTGTYHLYVWPPFNSSYMSYEQKELVVNSDIAKNVTLNTGYKLSGYITYTSGKAVSGAIVALDEYFNGYYSTYTGYYYVVAPAGTYTLTANPKTGVTFEAYNEANVVLNGDVSKNFTIVSQTKYKLSGYVTDANGVGLNGAQIIFNQPDVVPSVTTNALGYYEAYAPIGTYHLNIWPPFDSNYLSYDQAEFVVTGAKTTNFTFAQGYKVSGYITDSQGNPINGAIAILGNHISGWFSKSNGYYFVTAPAGTYTLTVQPRTGPSFATFTLSNFAVYDNVIQNITVTG